jgi:hypothetical protein
MTTVYADVKLSNTQIWPREPYDTLQRKRDAGPFSHMARNQNAAFPSESLSDNLRHQHRFSYKGEAARKLSQGGLGGT